MNVRIVSFPLREDEVAEEEEPEAGQDIATEPDAGVE